MKLYKYFSTNLIFLSIIFVGNAQQDAQKEYYNFYDATVGIQASNLYEGILFTEQYLTRNESSQYFKSKDFLGGSVVYNGQDFFDIQLKFDVYRNELLIKLITSVGGGTLQLFKDRLDGFVIDGHKFVKFSPEEVTFITEPTFFEESYLGTELNLYTKPVKNIFKSLESSQLYYEFKPGQSQYLIKKNGVFHLIKGKKDIVKLFPSLKKEINKFYKIASGLRNSDIDKFYLSLVNRIDILQSQNN